MASPQTPDRRQVLISMATILAAGSTASAAPFAARRAFVVGLDYPGSPGLAAMTPPLTTPLNDCGLICDALGKLNFEPIIKAYNKDQTSFHTAFSAFLGALAQDDLALIYVAGHGIQIDGQNWLLLSDGVSFESVPSLVEALRSKCRTVVIFLDVCRNNPFAIPEDEPNKAPKVRAVVAEPDLMFSFENFGLDQSRIEKKTLDEMDAAVLQGLGRLEVQGTGVRIVFATDPRNGATDHVLDTDRDGPFAKSVAARILERESLDNVISRVTDDVLTATNGAQSPWLSGSLREPIFLAGQPRNKNLTTPPLRLPG